MTISQEQDFTYIGPLASFTVFSSLPVELRLRIWNLAIDVTAVPRIVSLEPKQNGNLLPSLLHMVSKEARNEVCRRYERLPSKTAANPYVVFFSYERDSLFLDRRSRSDWEDPKQSLPADFTCNPEVVTDLCMQRVQRLVLATTIYIRFFFMADDAKEQAWMRKDGYNLGDELAGIWKGKYLSFYDQEHLLEDISELPHDLVCMKMNWFWTKKCFPTLRNITILGAYRFDELPKWEGLKGVQGPADPPNCMTAFTFDIEGWRFGTPVFAENMGSELQWSWWDIPEPYSKQKLVLGYIEVDT